MTVNRRLRDSVFVAVLLFGCALMPALAQTPAPPTTTAKQPQVAKPPVAKLPVTTPPVVTQPVVTPPVVTPPVTTPPISIPTPAVAPPADYVIGPDDVLTVVFWREKDLSGDVAVRPDGRISLPLMNDVDVAGLTPEQLRVRLTELADQFIEEPTVTVVVKQINSRKVFITGQVSKPGPYPLMGPTTVVQLIATAGGVLEYADDKNIAIMRTENGRAVSLRFNYDEVKKRKKLQQNIMLKPGDTIIVP
ncbi:MAG: polysaccharide biosynthesis/export family protein [Acidobacteria bacterium]|nr:polysaccharide biosynthesis/export family protein [Acidobacteriota bacterium]